jgi:hypothetical protein
MTARNFSLVGSKKLDGRSFVVSRGGTEKLREGRTGGDLSA